MIQHGSPRAHSSIPKGFRHGKFSERMAVYGAPPPPNPVPPIGHTPQVKPCSDRERRGTKECV